MERVLYFNVVKYVDDAVRYEPINVGVICHIPEEHWATAKFTANLLSLARLSRNLNLPLMRHVLQGFREILDRGLANEDLGHPHYLDRLAARYEGQIEVRQGGARVLQPTEVINTVVERIFHRYISLADPSEGRRKPGGGAVRRKVAAALGRSPVFPVLRQNYAVEIPANKYAYEVDYWFQNGVNHAIVCLNLDVAPKEADDRALAWCSRLHKTLEAGLIGKRHDILMALNLPRHSDGRSEVLEGLLQEVATVIYPDREGLVSLRREVERRVVGEPLLFCSTT